MGEIREMEKMITAKELAKNEQVTVRAINERWKENFREIKFDANALLSPEQVAVLREAGKRKRTKRRTKQTPVPPTTQEVRPEPKATAASWRFPSWAQAKNTVFNTLAVGTIVGHGALIWYECGKLWGGVGAIGGGVVFMVVLLAVLLAADPSKNRTSSYAIGFMLMVDIAAFWVHYPSFVNYAVSDVVRTGICIFICASSFMALLLFRDHKLD